MNIFLSFNYTVEIFQDLNDMEFRGRCSLGMCRLKIRATVLPPRESPESSSLPIDKNK